MPALPQRADYCVRRSRPSTAARSSCSARSVPMPSSRAFFPRWSRIASASPMDSRARSTAVQAASLASARRRRLLRSGHRLPSRSGSSDIRAAAASRTGARPPRRSPRRSGRSHRAARPRRRRERARPRPSASSRDQALRGRQAPPRYPRPGPPHPAGPARRPAAAPAEVHRPAPAAPRVGVPARKWNCRPRSAGPHWSAMGCPVVARPRAIRRCTASEVRPNAARPASHRFLNAALAKTVSMPRPAPEWHRACR